VNTAQCTIEEGSGVLPTGLVGTCGIYDNKCKKKCSELELSDCNTRGDDCFWLLGNYYAQRENSCKNKV
jgi:hypothetical protein